MAPDHRRRYQLRGGINRQIPPEFWRAAVVRHWWAEVAGTTLWGAPMPFGGAPQADGHSAVVESSAPVTQKMYKPASPRKPPAIASHSGGIAFSFARFSVGLVLFFILLPQPSARAQAEQLSDTDLGRKVMVDYIVHFAHHLQWPIDVFNGANAPFRICVMGDDELVAPLTARLHHHRIRGRMASLERVNDGEMLRARRCQIVVMGDMGAERLAQAVGALEFFPVLTVSDVRRFANLGGMVEFAGSGANMALQLNKTRLDRAELKMGNSLFRLGRQVN